MEVWNKQLKQMDQDIAAQSAEVKAALEARLHTEDPKKEAILERAYDHAIEKENQLVQLKQALIAKMPNPGEPTLLQHVVSSIKQCGTDWCVIGAEYHRKHLQARMCHALARAAQMMCIG